MASLPKTALRRNKLKDLTAGPAAPKSGHVVTQVEFVDFDGCKKKGFFKPLDETYPELLAKISVATSVIIRMLLGERAAEDRLVYDEDDKIVGTVSIALEGFKPFNYGSEPIPEHPQKKEEVNPSYETLMQHNVMELLFFSWFLGNDDLHPKNIGLKGLIDWDMFFYALTEIIKGPRAFGSSPEGKIELPSSDFANFPVLQETKLTHWATHQYPHNYYYPKRYGNYDQFIELSKNPIFKDESLPNGQITAQEQLFTAALKALVIFQPEVLEKQLRDALGKEPLNYTELSLEKKGELEKKFPTLFTSETDKQPFVSFMCGLYQLYYDELYRNVVFFKGCEKNISDVPVPGFAQFLYQHPSAFKSVEKWGLAQNKKRKEQEDKTRRFSNEDNLELKSEVACAPPLEKATKTDVCNKRQLKEDKLKLRYHQVWRDSYLGWMKNILKKAKELSNELLLELSLKGHEIILTDSEDSEIKPEDSSIHAAWQLLPAFKEINSTDIDEHIDCDKNSDMRKGLLALIDLNNQLFVATNNYYHTDLNELVHLKNSQFIRKLREISSKYFDEVIPKLGENTSYADKCGHLASELERFCGMVHFSAHMNTTDKVSLSVVPVKEIWPKHTDEKAINDCLHALFNWAKSLDAMTLSDKICKIIDEDYSGGLLSNRMRAEPVKTYLRESMKESGDDRLAFILSSGNKTGNGALNTCLIDQLIRDMLKATQHDFNVCLPSVRSAIDDKTFALDFYTEAAIKYAKNDNRFRHIYSDYALRAVNDALYSWVEELEHKRFSDLTKSALSKYEQSKSWFTTSRRSEVEKYFSISSNAHILARIFMNGGFETTSLNTILFNTLLDTMQKEIPLDKEQLQKANNHFVMRLTQEYRPHFISSIKSIAEEKLHQYPSKETVVLKSFV